VLLSSCATDTTNKGGEAEAQYTNGSNTLTFATNQPENPNNSAYQKAEFFDNGNLKSFEIGTGGAFKNVAGKLKGIFGLSKLCILGGMLCAVIGAIILQLPITYSNKIGWSVIACGASFGAFGAILPNFGIYALVIALIGGGFGVWYMFYQKSQNAKVIQAGLTPPEEFAKK
jgi:hypothetical protein